MALTADALVSFSEAQDIIDMSDQTLTAAETITLERIVERASKRLSQAIGTEALKQAPSDVTEDYDGSGFDFLVLRRFPDVVITTIHVDQNQDFLASSLVSPDDFVVDSDWGIVRLKSSQGIFPTGLFPRGALNVRVVYNGGFLVVPEDLKEACLQLVAISWGKVKHGAYGITSEAHGGLSMAWDKQYGPNGLPMGVEMIVNSRKRRMTG